MPSSRTRFRSGLQAFVRRPGFRHDKEDDQKRHGAGGGQRQEGHAQAKPIGDPAGQGRVEGGAEAGGQSEGPDRHVEEPGAPCEVGRNQRN